MDKSATILRTLFLYCYIANEVMRLHICSALGTRHLGAEVLILELSHFYFLSKMTVEGADAEYYNTVSRSFS